MSALWKGKMQEFSIYGVEISVFYVFKQVKDLSFHKNKTILLVNSKRNFNVIVLLFHRCKSIYFNFSMLRPSVSGKLTVTKKYYVLVFISALLNCE